MMIRKIAQRIFIGILITVVSFAGLPFLQTLSVSAQSLECDEEFYSSNSIPFFNPCENACSADSSVSSTVTELLGDNNKDKILNYLQARGLSPSQAAGLTANFQYESGFSAFRQEEGKNWPSGGYGIAQFTGGQRTAVENFLVAAVGQDLYDSYYSPVFGGAVSADNGFVPEGVSIDVNDRFLLGQLDYVYQYTSDFAPSIIPARVNELKQDHGLTIDSGVKLMDFIKSLESEADVAKAWTYLYEYPNDILKTSNDRATAATTILSELSASSAAPDTCSVSAGGLDFEQASRYMEAFHTNKKSYFLDELQNSFWAQPGQVNQCTTFVMYSVNKYVAPLDNTRHGKNTASYVAEQLPGFYTLVSMDEVKPFTVFSMDNGGAGHTGMILGVLSDGSVIIGEANSDPSGLGEEVGLLQKATFGQKIDAETDDPGIAAVEHWVSVEAYFAAWASWDYGNPTFAAPTDPETILGKLIF